MNPANDSSTAESELVLQNASPRRIPLASRRAALIAALVLSVVLVALLVYLMYLLLDKPGVTANAATEAGLRSRLVLTGPGTGSRPQFKQPMAAAWGPDGRIYVADTGNNRICVFNAKGDFLFEFGTFGIAKPLAGSKATWKPGALDYPTGIDVDPSTGDVYVADFYNNTVEVFDQAGAYLRNFPDPNKVVGKGGSGFDGHGIAVTDVAVSGDRVYATDAFQILVFNRAGTLLQQFGKPGVGRGDLDRPNGVTADHDGSIVVADSNHSRLIRFDGRGRAVQTVGEQVKSLSEPTTNPFILPRGLSLLDDGSIIVADPLAMQLVRIGTAGQVVAKYGDRGVSPAQLNFANDVDARGRLLVIADRGNNRVQVVSMVGE